MRIYIDSAGLEEITQALATGYVYGVTTNPTLLRRANLRRGDVEALARQAFDLGAREIHLQTYSADAGAIVLEGLDLAGIDSKRVAVKVPAVPQGYAAAARLVEKNVRVTMTAVYTVRQALLADAIGAAYIAVYLGRMRDAGLDALQLVGRMQRTLNAQGSRMEILAASVRTPEEVEDLAELGVATATLPWKVLSSLLESDATDAAAATFLEDAGAIQ
jgi:transaldolase